MFQMERKPKAVDLFSGAGGLTEGLRQAGYNVVGAVEIDPLACRTYKINHKKVKLWETNIRRLTAISMMKSLNLKAGELDLLAACPPCQGFSTMRTNNGTRWNRDTRNDLIFQVLRFIRKLKPKSVMLENVPGLAENNRFTKFRKSLEKLGYFIKWGILNTADFGVPQSRRRLVLLASSIATPEFSQKVEIRKTVRQSIGNLTEPQRSRDPLHNYVGPCRTILPVVQAEDFCSIACTIGSGKNWIVRQGHYVVQRSEKVHKLIRRIPKDGGSRNALGKADQLRCHKGFNGFWDVYGRMAWDKPSPTITGGCINPSKGRFLHPDADRAITLREAALLQTFPKRYHFEIENGRYSVALMIGNALPPEFIRRQAKALKQIG